MTTIKIAKETACIMYMENNELKNSYFINQMEFEYLTPVQLGKLVERLSDEKAHPIKLYKHNVTDSLYLVCKNKKYIDRAEMFTFAINTDGKERGKGFDYVKNIDNQYTELIDFENTFSLSDYVKSEVI